jgi:tRNA(adenine34) deaminase
MLGLTPEIYARHCDWMQKAIQLAAVAAKRGDVPVGAIMVNEQGQVISTAYNRKEQNHDPTAHAEILAIQDASQALKTWHLENCTLYVTLEPCPMCTGAIIQARLGLLVYGADDPKSGTIRTVFNLPDSPASNHRLKVIAGILEATCREQLQTWFAQQRRLKTPQH